MRLLNEIVPMTCIDGRCNRAGIQVIDNREKCFECGGDLFPYGDFDFREVEGDFDDDDDAFELGTELLQSHRLRGHNVQANLFEAMGEYRGSVATPQREIASDTFSCPSDLSGCPIASKAKVNIPVDLFNKWVFLARKLDTEWIAYLLGEETATNEYTITGMYFPKQKANGVHCEAEDGEIREGTIAAVHSHVGMKAFFSGEDEKHFNHAIELVVNRMGDILANGRTVLECGRHHRGAASIFFTGCEQDLEMEKELREKVSKDTGMFKTNKAVDCA